VPRLVTRATIEGETAYSHTLRTSTVELIKHAQGRDPKALDILQRFVEGKEDTRLSGTP
jgi:hypothetical protein